MGPKWNILCFMSASEKKSIRIQKCFRNVTYSDETYCYLNSCGLHFSFCKRSYIRRFSNCQIVTFQLIRRPESWNLGLNVNSPSHTTAEHSPPNGWDIIAEVLVDYHTNVEES